MASYSKSERLVAKILESTPWLRDVIRWSYKRVIYLLHRKPGFECDVHSDYTIKTPYDLINLDENEKEELFFGYYDKSPWNKSMTKAVFHSLEEENKIGIRLFDFDKKSSKIIDHTVTWNHQQGAMVQWLD